MELQPRIAVLVDADNVQAGHIAFAVSRAARYGAVVLKRAFGRLSSVSGHGEKLAAYGFTAEVAFPGGNGKNAADLMLAQYATRLAERRAVETVVLVTSDGDFAPVAIGLAEAGLRTIGFGRSDTPATLQSALGLFIPFPGTTSAARPASIPVSPASTSARPASTPAGVSESDAARLSGIIEGAMENGRVPLAVLGIKVRGAFGGYGTRFGVQTLGALIERLDGYHVEGDGTAKFAVRSPTARIVNMPARPAASG